MSSIFKTYTGNAMLNNALMAIESIGELSEVSEVTPSILIKLFDSTELPKINQRLKSYTMVFSLNNPLVNPAKKAGNAGEITYDNLMRSILSSFENTGEYVCEVSGLRFQKTFEDFYKEELENQKEKLRGIHTDPKELKKETDKIDRTDISLNRTWFPLIGGLGSDAQALPQAKYAIKIHPICIPILQFLPLAAVLYKGGILLVDSSNFFLAKEIVATNVNAVREKIQAHSTDKSVENIRDFNKGSHLLRALEILGQKELYEETYSDLNLWNFSNSGTGASCEIDRVPNRLIRVLQKLYRNIIIRDDLKLILSSDRMYKFLESLENGKEWYGLYPAVFGSGKKRIEYQGMSPEFLEAYFNVIQSSKSIDYGKYIAGLVNQYKNKNTKILLQKTDGWSEKDFRIELYRIFVQATKENKWNLQQQIQILDNSNILPVRNSFWNMHRLIHFYVFKGIFSYDLPAFSDKDNEVYRAVKLLTVFIQRSSEKNRIIKRLLDDNDYKNTSFEGLILESAGEYELPLDNIIEVFYDNEFKFAKRGMIELLRIYFSQNVQEEYSLEVWDGSLNHSPLFQDWKDKLREFVSDYQQYYFERYLNINTQRQPVEKFARVITSMVNPRENFFALLNQAIQNTNLYFIDNKLSSIEKWTIEELLTNPFGEFSPGLARLAIKFIMKDYIKNLQQQLLTQNT